MDKPKRSMTPVEIIFDIFIAVTVFAALAAGFMIVIQTLNAAN